MNSESTTFMIGLATWTFIGLMFVVAWVFVGRTIKSRYSGFGGASRSTEIKSLGTEAEFMLRAAHLPREVLTGELAAIDAAVNDGLTDRKFSKHYIGLLDHFVRFIGNHRTHIIETVLYTVMYVPDEDSGAEIPTHLTDEHFRIGEAFLDAFVEGRLDVPADAEGNPDRGNGDVFYTLLNYALENIEYAWMFLDILIDHGINDLRKAERFLENAKTRGFEALLSGAV